MIRIVALFGSFYDLNNTFIQTVRSNAGQEIANHFVDVTKMIEIDSHSEREIARFPNAAANPDEQRRFRAALYRPLLLLTQEERAEIVGLIVNLMLGADRVAL